MSECLDNYHQESQSFLILGFLLFLLFTSNPFSLLSESPNEGLGLHPILQDPFLAIHPPILYLGYVGFSLIFSLAIAGLLLNHIDKNWASIAKKWTLSAWILLTAGIGLGSYWAYNELGWGGYWFWDPVENASLMPWLAGTALIHCVSILEKRNTTQSKEREIYKKHQEFFDYFSKNNFDPEWISLLIQKTLLKNGYKLGSINSKYVRFYPLELTPYIYKSKKRNTWEHREIFIFELEIKEKNKIVIRSCVNRRGDEDFDYDGLLKIIDTIPNAKQRNKDWVFSHEKEFPIDYLKIAKVEESSAINDLEKIFKSYKNLFIDKYIQTFSNGEGK